VTDALTDAFAICWAIPSEVHDAGDLAVEIRVWLNASGIVKSARILDAARMYRDRVYRIAAKGALRAVLNPACQPFPLLCGVYDLRFTPAKRFVEPVRARPTPGYCGARLLS
jgi:hypothetical protein